MMESLKNYLLSVVAVSLIAAIASVMIKNPLILKVVRLVSGVLVLLVVISPLLQVDLEEITAKMKDTLSPNTEMLDDVQERSKQQLKEQIQSATETHIEQMAARFGMLIQAKVTVNDDKIPEPIKVELIGVLDPEQIATLTNYIEQNIGIPKENQKWRGYEANS